MKLRRSLPLSLKSLFNYLVSGGEAETQYRKDFWKRDAMIMPRHLSIICVVFK